MDNRETPGVRTPTFEGSVESRTSLSIVHAAGEVDIASAPALTSLIHEAMDSGPTQLVIDMSLVTMLDSSGLGVLISTLKLLEGDGNTTQLHLIVTEPQVMKVFAVTGLDGVFSFLDSASALPGWE